MKKSHKKIKIFFVFMLVFFSFSLQAEIYKWVDKNGRVHYDDKLPLQNNKQLMNINEESNAVSGLSDGRLEKRKKLLDAIDEDRQLKKDEAEKKKKKKARLAKQCHNARDALKNYQRSSYVYDLDKDGNRVILPSSTRDKVIANLKKQIEAQCSN
ncbi:MAG: DUF4124 domain-containing protein [Gammaproteobacteria bacterium]|nr:DUF4124 domain-containing protein [Gammaproteobacteria bacterium]